MMLLHKLAGTLGGIEVIFFMPSMIASKILRSLTAQRVVMWCSGNIQMMFTNPVSLLPELGIKFERRRMLCFGVKEFGLVKECRGSALLYGWQCAIGYQRETE